MARESRLRQTSRLTVRERSFMTMTVDALYQTLDDTFRMHVKRALGAGADRETLREVLVYGALFGCTRAWNALRALEDALPA